MAPPQEQGPRWIVGPTADLIFFGFGWLPVFLGLWWLSDSAWSETAIPACLTVILAVNFLHRHATFPLVYGDPEIFAPREAAYRWLPAVFLAVTVGCLLYVQQPAITGAAPASDRALVLAKDTELRLRYGHDRESTSRADVLVPAGRHDLASVVAHIDSQLGPDVSATLQNGRVRLNLDAGGAQGWLRLSGPDPVLADLGFSAASTRSGRGSRPLFNALAMLSVLWTIYHTLMQKLGLVRIYSRQTGVGSPRLDRGLVFSWFFVVVLLLGGRSDVRDQAARISSTGRFLRPWLDASDAILPLIIGLTTLAAATVAVRFLWLELAGQGRRTQVHVPKLAYIASIFCLYLALCIDLPSGYAAFGFSHSIEYLCFVVAFSTRKFARRPISSSLMARWIHDRRRSIAIYTLFSLSIFFAARLGWRTQLSWYIVGSSFLHFIYDGWIWKVRKPGVATPLGITPGATTGGPG